MSKTVYGTRDDAEIELARAVLVLEDVAVVHGPAGVGVEPRDDVDDLVGIDSYGALQAALVVVETVADAVVDGLIDVNGRSSLVAVPMPPSGVRPWPLSATPTHVREGPQPV